MLALVVQILMILIVINAARTRRGKCNWELEQTQKRMRLVGIIMALVLPLFINAPPTSLLAIFIVALMLYSVFILSRALYRKADLRRSPYNA